MTSTPSTCLTMQVDPLPGKRVATVLVLADEAAGVLEGRARGEEDQHPGDHRGGASGAGSPHSNQESPSVLFSLWPSHRPRDPM